MKNNLIIFTLLLLSFLSNYGQEKIDSLIKKTNPIIFGDVFVGYTNGAIKGITVGASLNHQIKNNLFTFRIIQTTDIESVDFFIFIPYNIESNTTTEYSFLFGKRFIKDEFSYHFSGGFSYNTYSDKENNVEINDKFVGFPLEIGISWFNSEKKRYRVLFGLIPVGKPTSFGKSIGLKLYGNIAERSYIGMGLTFGLGWHKSYNE